MNRRMARLLTETRVEAGMTQGEVADLVGIKKNTLCNYEHGLSEPTLDTLVDLFCVYGIDPSYAFAVSYGTPLREGVSSPEEERLLDLYRTADGRGRETILQTAKLEAHHAKEQQKWFRRRMEDLANESFLTGEEQLESQALSAYLEEESEEK